MILDGMQNFSKMCLECRIFILATVALGTLLFFSSFYALDIPVEPQFFLFPFLIGCVVAAGPGQFLDQMIKELNIQSGIGEARSVILCL